MHYSIDTQCFFMDYSIYAMIFLFIRSCEMEFNRSYEMEFNRSYALEPRSFVIEKGTALLCTGTASPLHEAGLTRLQGVGLGIIDH